jgi:hypothetical protein
MNRPYRKAGPRLVAHAGASAAAVLAASALCAGCDETERKPKASPVAPAAEIAAPHDVQFEECAEKAGMRFRMRYLPDEQGENFKINLYDHGCGVAVADIDGDAKDDVFFCNQLGPCSLFKNLGGGRFDDVTRAAGDVSAALDGRICVAAAFGDTDADGDQDLYVTTTRGGNVYLENVGSGRFRDATKDAGLVFVAESETPCFFDADADGDLDLFVTNTARWTLEDFDAKQRYFRGKATLLDLIASPGQSNVFYLNDGKGRFTDATAASGLASKGWGGDVAVFDVDGDRDLDVFVGNMFGGSVLWRNDGKGKFEDVTKSVLGRVSWGAVGVRAFDYDGDARLDLFVVDMHSDMWTPPQMDPAFVQWRKKYPTFYARAIEVGLVPAGADAEFERTASIRKDDVVFGNTLYRAKEGGGFEEVSDAAGAETFWPWGIAEGDFDADGLTDAFIPSGMGHPFFYRRSPLLLNRGNGKFEDVARVSATGQGTGTEPPPDGVANGDVYHGRPAVRSSRAAATADFDGDGRLDLVVNNFNARAYLYRNVSAPRHWCELRLTATKGHRDAIGALVRLTAGGRTQVRQVQAAGGYLSQSSNALHFGLGDATSIEKVEILWPGGRTETRTDVPVDALTKIVEPAN